MAAKITTRLVELTYEAALKSYWRKNALRKFLRGFHLADSLISTWSDDESKRDFLDRVFDKLQSTDNGKAVIFQMALSLAEQKTFPDLCDWEDSDAKIPAATKAVQELSSYLRSQDEEIRSERDREQTKKKAHEERVKIRRSLSDKVSLQSRLDALCSEVGTQDGGYKFETWFYDFLDYFDIDNRRPYKSKGRQIDGSLTYEGTTYLVELKFTKNQSDATDVDSLKAKVGSKADNTMGIFISISGYSSVAIGEASGQKALLLLLDVHHIYMCLVGNLHFGDIVSRVRRHASQTGEVYLPVSEFGG